MIDAATPLLGMVMRVTGMSGNAMPEHLFTQVVTDVQAVEQLLQEQGYEPGVIVSFRYILCTFIDEAALGNGWSNKKRVDQTVAAGPFPQRSLGRREGLYSAGAELTNPLKIIKVLDFYLTSLFCHRTATPKVSSL